MNLDRFKIKRIETGELFSQYHSDRIDRDEKEIVMVIKEINKCPPENISMDDMEKIIIFFEQNFIKLDYIKNAHDENNKVKVLRKKLIESFSNWCDKSDVIRGNLKFLNNKNKLSTLFLVLEATNEIDLLNKIKVEKNVDKINESRLNLLFDITYFKNNGSDITKHQFDRIWRFSNDIFGFKKDNAKLESVIKDFLVENDFKFKEKYLKSTVWFKVGLDLNLINPSIQNLKSFYLKLISVENTFFAMTQESIKERSEMFFETFVKTDVFKSEIATKQDLEIAFWDIFGEQIGKSHSPKWTVDAIKESKLLFKEFLKNQMDIKSDVQIGKYLKKI